MLDVRTWQKLVSIVYFVLDEQDGIEKGSSKHVLTPSKEEREPNPKRVRPLTEQNESSNVTVLSKKSSVKIRPFNERNDSPNVDTASFKDNPATAVVETPARSSNKKDRYFKERSEERVAILRENYIKSPGSEVRQSEVLELLSLSNTREGKQMATVVVRKAFEGANLSRKKNLTKI